MTYKNLADCVTDLERNGMLRRVDCELSSELEVAAVQRRAFQKQGPALLFTNVKGCSFPMLGNLFGTMERTRFIFRSTLRRVEEFFTTVSKPQELKFLKNPAKMLRLAPAFWHALPRQVKTGPVLQYQASLSQLPQLVSWPQDGGAYITLPLVYTEDPENPGLMRSNIGMYRVQLSGGELKDGEEVGLHYQLHRGIGQHHAKALQRGEALQTTIFVGGPPALSIAGVMPLPEGISELVFGGILAGHRLPVIRTPGLPIVPAEADFCITGHISNELKPEGPFGDHLGYYSLQHDFPVMKVTGVFHRHNAIWPFTTVGRPPQEDTIFGDFIHELTGALLPVVFPGIHEIHAVDAAGVHPLLLAVGSERYTPYEKPRKPRELLAQGLHLMGNTQTALSKYVLLAAREDSLALSTRDMDAFFKHILERTNFEEDLHIFTRMPMDTLDYTGSALHEGSKMLWVAAGEIRRELSSVLPHKLFMPEGFYNLHVFRPGIILCTGPRHNGNRGESDPAIENLAATLDEQASLLSGFPWLIVVDDIGFSGFNWENFLWTVFTRSDPATDSYGAGDFIDNKHWGCRHTFITDARMKSFLPPPLQEDPTVERRIELLGASGGPLHGLV